MRNADFWYFTPCGSCKNRCCGGTYHPHHQVDMNRRVRNNLSTINRSALQEILLSRIVFLRSVLRLIVSAKVVPNSPILVTLIMEAIRSSEASVLTRATRRNISEHDIFTRNPVPYMLYFLVIYNSEEVAKSIILACLNVVCSHQNCLVSNSTSEFVLIWSAIFTPIPEIYCIHYNTLSLS
jgi:hypothetical protein